MSKSEPGPIKITLAVIAFLVVLPVALPVAAVQHLFIEKRRARTASTFACLKCHKVLGKEALVRADEQWQQYMNSFAERGLIPRVVRTVWAICECGQKYDYNEKSNSFVVCSA